MFAPERLQHVGAAGLRRHRPAAVLRDARAGGGGDEHRRGGDVERVRGVAAGADDVDQVLLVRDLDARRELAHDLRRRGDLADGFLLDPQSDGERRDHDRRRFAAHDPAHQREHLVVEDLPVLDRALQGFLHGDGHVVLWRGLGQAMASAATDAGMARKFRSSAWPCSVRMASGWNCTPSTARVAVAHAHDLAIFGGGAHPQALRAGSRARSPASGSASPGTAMAARRTRRVRRASPRTACRA